MTRYIIPFDSKTADQKLSVDLSGETFIFRVRWNTRAEKWMLSMADENEADIFNGLALMLGVNFFELVTDERLPDGFLYTFNFESEFVEATRDNLGTDYFLIYDDGLS